MLDQTNAVLRLTVVNPVDEGNPFIDPQEFTFEGYEAQEIFIGRAPGNSVVLNNLAVSGQHIRILNQGNDFILHDLGSRNGTHLNERRMDANDQKLLRDGDRIRIVNYVIQVHAGVSAFQPQSSENTRQIALDMIKSVLGGASGHEESPPKLMVMSGQQQGASIDLSDVYAEIRIGRSPLCEFPIHDENISREHALVRRDWTGIFIKDMNSRNGVVINGERLGRSDERQLRDRDEILLGTVKLSFSDPEGARLDDQMGDVVADGILGQNNQEVNDLANREPIPMPSMPHPEIPNSDQMPENEDNPPSPLGDEPSDSLIPKVDNNADENDSSEASLEQENDDDFDESEDIDGFTAGQKTLIAILITVAVLFLIVLISLFF